MLADPWPDVLCLELVGKNVPRTFTWAGRWHVTPFQQIWFGMQGNWQAVPMELTVAGKNSGLCWHPRHKLTHWN